MRYAAFCSRVRACASSRVICAMQQRRLELRHAQVRAGAAVGEIVAGVAPAAAVVVEAVAGLDERFVVGQDGAALAGVQVLARLKAEAPGLAVGADLAATPLRQVRLAGVLDDGYAALAARRPGSCRGPRPIRRGAPA